MSGICEFRHRRCLQTFRCRNTYTHTHTPNLALAQDRVSHTAWRCAYIVIARLRRTRYEQKLASTAKHCPRIASASMATTGAYSQFSSFHPQIHQQSATIKRQPKKNILFDSLSFRSDKNADKSPPHTVLSKRRISHRKEIPCPVL